MTQEATPSQEDKAPEVVVDIGGKPAATPVTPEESPEGAVYEYEATGDPALDMALQFVGKAGIGANDPALLAAEQGDFSILRAKLAAKGVPGWEQFVALGEAAYKKAADATAAKAEALKELVVKEAGGAEQWAAVQSWAKENASPEEKAEINAMLNAGGLQAKQATRYLVAAYEKAGNVTEEPRDGTANAARGGNAGGGNDTGPLSPSAYVQAVKDLNVKLRGRIDDSPEYVKLQQRRAAFRG